MAVPQQRAPGFFGPADAGVQAGRKSMRRHAAGHRTVRLPRSVAADLSRMAAASRLAAEGETRAALGSLERTLLQRISLGPTLNDSTRIEAIGYDAYLDEQLNFDKLDDSELEAALQAALPTLTSRWSRSGVSTRTTPSSPCSSSGWRRSSAPCTAPDSCTSAWSCSGQTTSASISRRISSGCSSRWTTVRWCVPTRCRRSPSCCRPVPTARRC